ncbi:unnamed protein product [Rhizoctonia solani]|uniref:Cutinase n=1 Tax=Rhizoctonia solani TaxID=456999 RepID=A0A8H3D163_9AGAM|nr:unnamed protein product [Rhizoctonia solani]
MSCIRIIMALMCIVLAMGTPVGFGPGVHQSCSTLHFVHASGTFEEPGLGATGGPLAIALANAIPGTTSYGVPYNTTSEFNKTIDGGATMIAQHLHDQMNRCPDQKFVLSGASKGAMVIHSTKPDNDIKSKVFVIFVFGDPWRPKDGLDNLWPIDLPSVNLNPRNGTSTTDNVISFCNVGDSACEIGSVDPNAIPPSHLTYPIDGSIDISAALVKSKVQSS